MKALAVSSLALALAFAAGSANANDYYETDRGYDDAYGYDTGYSRDGGSAYDMARVLSVDPIIEPGQPVNRRECWREPAPTYARDYRHDPRYDPRYDRQPRRTSGGGAVLGAIVGGVLGNSVGSGDGRQAATVAGAVIGGAIGHNIERNGQRRDDAYGQRDDRYYGHNAGYGPAEVERCRVVTDYRRDERVVGYRVAYEYAGRTWQTVTDYHPGSEIRVRVDVTPEG
jgi:uncharacterized protein YcfJ